MVVGTVRQRSLWAPEAQPTSCSYLAPRDATVGAEQMLGNFKHSSGETEERRSESVASPIQSTFIYIFFFWTLTLISPVFSISDSVHILVLARSDRKMISVVFLCRL